MDEINESNAGGNLEPVSQNLSDRELFRLKNAEELKDVGTSDNTDSSTTDKVTDVKEKAQPIVKDDANDVEGKGFKRRVDTLTSRNKSLESELKAMRDEINAMKNPKAPKRELDETMFLDNSEYVKALAKQQALDAVDERESQRRNQYEEANKSQKEIQQQQQQWANRVNKTFGGDEAQVERFYANIEQNSDVLNAMPSDVHDFIDDSPVGVKVMDALLNHPEIVDYLSKIKSPTYRAIEMREIEKAVSSSSVQKPVNTVSKAPAPVGTVGTVGNAQSDDDLTFRERLLKKQKLRGR
jgi:chaperonin cofactor prefoldin